LTLRLWITVNGKLEALGLHAHENRCIEKGRPPIDSFLGIRPVDILVALREDDQVHFAPVAGPPEIRQAKVPLIIPVEAAIRHHKGDPQVVRWATVLTYTFRRPRVGW
jgi:hypothetical protein